MRQMDLTDEIKDEISKALAQLGAHPHLLAIFGSWRDTLTDAEVLEALRDWNAGRFKIESFTSRPRLRLVR